jgi:hypothetical protein
VVGDGGAADEQLRGDLRIGRAVAGQAGDHRFLRGQRIPRVVGFVELAACLTSGGQVWCLALIASFFLLLAAACGRTGRSPTRWPGRTRRTGWSCRYGRSHGSSGLGGGEHGQDRGGPVQRLNLRLLAHAQDQCVFRGAMYRPTTSRTLSMNCGSADSFQHGTDGDSESATCTWSARAGRAPTAPPEACPGTQRTMRPAIRRYRHHRVTTIHPGGCASARRKRTVDVITQTCLRRRIRQGIIRCFGSWRRTSRMQKGEWDMGSIRDLIVEGAGRYDQSDPEGMAATTS